MAKYSRKEFCDLLGISMANLSTYVKRGKIVVDDDNTIDDRRRENTDFIKSRESKGLSKTSTPKETTVQVPTPVVELKSRKVKKAAEAATISKYNLDLEKTQAEIEKKYIDTELARMKLEVLQGNNVSIEDVLGIISELSKAFLINYNSSTEQFINSTCHKHSILDTDRVKMVSRMKDTLNSIHNKAVNDARTQVKNMIGANKKVESMQENDAE